jgi:predicted dehydrogenase
MIRVGIAGCGSVSREYLENLGTCRHARVVAVCDVDVRRAQARAEEFGISRAFGSLDEMLAECTFDLLVNLTAMPAHYAVNLTALRAGKHVMSEKPMASTYQDGTELVREADARGLSLFAAPSCCGSPAFGALRDLIASGELGEVYAAHARYGHSGPDWGPWFYGPRGGPILDLAVYNVTFLTGLLGPAHAVTALTATTRPHRTVEGMDVAVECEDNAAILLDHGRGRISCVQTGFVYGRCRDDWSVELIGAQGSAYLLAGTGSRTASRCGPNAIPGGIGAQRTRGAITGATAHRSPSAAWRTEHRNPPSIPSAPSMCWRSWRGRGRAAGLVCDTLLPVQTMALPGSPKQMHHDPQSLEHLRLRLGRAPGDSAAGARCGERGGPP